MKKKVDQNIKPILSEFKSALQNLYGNNLISLILYGSYSRGQEKDNSDIDILVILRSMKSPYAEIRRMSDIKFEILEKYEKVLSTVPTTKERYEKLEVPLYRVIHKEGIMI